MKTPADAQMNALVNALVNTRVNTSYMSGPLEGCCAAFLWIGTLCTGMSVASALIESEFNFSG